VIALSAPQIGDAERHAVERVLKSGMLAQGPEVAAFETEFAEAIGVQYAIAVNSGTSALHLGLVAAGIGQGDEVIVPSFTFAATANAVRLAGAEPVFADIDPETFCLDPDAAAAAITPRTAGVMPVHLYGHPADMSAFSSLAQRHGILLVEDAAQAHLASWDGRQVGSFGLGMFSFYPTKNMTSGEGGMITTDDAEIARRSRLLRNQGMERRYENEIVGFNCRMTDIHAAIGRVQLADLPTRTSARQRIAAHYSRHISSVVVPTVRRSAQHVYHQYTVRVPVDRDRFLDHLGHRGIGAAVYYPTPVHRLPSFRLELELPNTEAATREVASIPVHPTLSDHEIATVVEAVNEWS
jgi:perosamine synthetase